MSVRRLLLVVPVLGACSGSADDGSTPTSVAATAVPTTAAPTTVAPPTTAGITVPPTTGEPTTVPPTTVPPTTVPPTRVPQPRFDDWCGLALEVEAVTEGRDDVDFTDPVAVEAYIEPLAALMEQAVPLAPPDIAAEVALWAGNTLTIYDALSANGFDLLTLDLSEIGVVEDGADAATEAIETYDDAECGIPRPAGDGAGDGDSDGDGDEPTIDDPIDLVDGSLRDLFVGRLVAAGFDEPEADCLFGELDFGDPDGVTDDAVEAAFVACEIDPRRVDELSAVLGG